MENERIEYSNDNMIDVALEGNTLENYNMLMGKKRIISSCDINHITRITTGLTFLEEKQKLTIYYNKDGKEKRFGGLGFFLEGNLSNPEFSKFINALKAVLPDHVRWEEKSSAKKVVSTETGGTFLPINPCMEYVVVQKKSSFRRANHLCGYVLLYCDNFCCFGTIYGCGKFIF
jgi:hypothetical protein